MVSSRKTPPHLQPLLLDWIIQKTEVNRKLLVHPLVELAFSIKFEGFAGKTTPQDPQSYIPVFIKHTASVLIEF